MPPAQVCAHGGRWAGRCSRPCVTCGTVPRALPAGSLPVTARSYTQPAVLRWGLREPLRRALSLSGCPLPHCAPWAPLGSLPARGLDTVSRLGVGLPLFVPLRPLPGVPCLRIAVCSILFSFPVFSGTGSPVPLIPPPLEADIPTLFPEVSLKYL